MEASGQRNSGVGDIVHVDELLPVCEVRCEPGEGTASDVDRDLKAREKNGMVGYGMAFISCEGVDGVVDGFIR